MECCRISVELIIRRYPERISVVNIWHKGFARKKLNDSKSKTCSGGNRFIDNISPLRGGSHRQGILYYAVFGPGETIENSDGSVEIPFYLYKDAWQEYKANVINLTVVSKHASQEMVMMSLEMDPAARYSLDSLKLEFYVSNIYSAIRFEDPLTGESLPYDYKLSGNDSKAVLDFPHFDSQAGEKITIKFWLDLTASETPIAEGPILMDFAIHEHSVLKIARHVVRQHVLQLAIPE